VCHHTLSTQAGLHHWNLLYLGFFFALAGIAIAITDGLEDAVAGDLIPEQLRGTGYGTLAAVNGVGGFVSSTAVGFLWATISPLAGFGYGAVLTIAGAIALFGVRKK
jgi:MFS family permease